MKIEGKKTTLGAFFVVVWLPAVVLFMLQATGNFGDWIQALFYVSVTVASLVVLGTIIKSDDQYYQNLNPLNLVLAVIVGLIMTALSWGLSLQLQNPRLLSVGYTLSFIAAPGSVVTSFLSVMLFGLVMAATSEELLKLTMFAELKERYGSRWYGVLVYVGFPVGFWALLHGIQAYSNPIMILPAFINGVVLIILLLKTRCLLACIFSHFLYNAGITFLQFLGGSANVPIGTPLLPSFTNFSIADFATVIVLVASFLFFLLPSLRREQ